jgi:hypothetical protein
MVQHVYFLMVPSIQIQEIVDKGLHLMEFVVLIEAALCRKPAVAMGAKCFVPTLDWLQAVLAVDALAFASDNSERPLIRPGLCFH